MKIKKDHGKGWGQLWYDIYYKIGKHTSNTPILNIKISNEKTYYNIFKKIYHNMKIIGRLWNIKCWYDIFGSQGGREIRLRSVCCVYFSGEKFYDSPLGISREI